MRKTLAVIGLFVAPAALAQTVQPTLVAPAAPVAAIIANPTENVARAGTPVVLRLTEGLTTEHKALRIGQRVQMEVVEAVTINGMTVIPAGSPATGEVTDVRNKGMWGKSGRIGARALFARVGDRQIRLTGSFDDKGVTGTAGVVAAVAFVPVVGFFVTGTSARIPVGSQVKAFLDEDLVVASSVAPAITPVAPVSIAPVAVTSALPKPTS